MLSSVRDIMSASVITAKPEEHVTTIAQRLANNSISGAPVVDAGGRVLGVISEGDLMRPFGATHALHREWWLSLLAEGSDLAPAFLEYLQQDKRTVADLMTKPAWTVTEATSIAEAAETMTARNVKRLPVVRDGHLVGIVSRADLVRALYLSTAAAA